MQTVHNLGQCISALKMPAYLPAYGMAASANLTKQRELSAEKRQGHYGKPGQRGKTAFIRLILTLV
jgi:hypothetical protein